MTNGRLYPDWDKSDHQNLMKVSTPLGDLDWESSEKSGLMVDQRTGDDLLDTADEDQEEADLISEIERMLIHHKDCWRGSGHRHQQFVFHATTKFGRTHARLLLPAVMSGTRTGPRDG